MGCSCRALIHCYSVSPQGFASAVPFDNSLPEATATATMSGKRPSRPTHLTCTDELWTLIQRCWHSDPHLRPKVSEVLEPLRGP